MVLSENDNERLEHDLEVCIRLRVPVIITSLRAPDDVVKRILAEIDDWLAS